MSPSKPLLERLQKGFGTTYRIEREIGGAGMSNIFVAVDASLGRSVVIKVLPPKMSDQVSAGRFRREMQIAARLQHSHIVPVLTAGEVDGLLYYSMPLVEGETLRARLTRTPEFPVNEATKILEDLLSALSYAHKRGVVHRDMKPENILLSEHDALVADFGIAKALDASKIGTSSAVLTVAGMAMGTPAYMSPEQAAADPDVDERADLYAIGVIAYEMLAGAHPFTARASRAMLAAQIAERPRHLAQKRPDIPDGIASLVMRLLAKAPADRPQTAEEVLRSLERMGGG